MKRLVAVLVAVVALVSVQAEEALPEEVLPEEVLVGDNSDKVENRFEPFDINPFGIDIFEIHYDGDPSIKDETIENPNTEKLSVEKILYDWWFCPIIR